MGQLVIASARQCGIRNTYIYLALYLVQDTPRTGCMCSSKRAIIQMDGAGANLTMSGVRMVWL